MKPTGNLDKNIKVFKRVAIVFAAVIAALALALTFAFGFDGARRVSVDNAEQGEVITSQAFSNLAAGTDKSAPGALMNGDTITYTTTGSVFSIKLPAGTYTLQAWGAQGGYGYGKSGDGGKGGYTEATYKTTDVSTLYIAVGGAGSNRLSTSGKKTTIYGGYNGGGNAISLRTNCAHGGGGGGGATHFATSGGTLSEFKTSTIDKTADILIVAGGGGGAGNIATVGGMGGGTASGVTGVVAGGSASNAKGGSTSGGTCSGTRPGVTGTFGQGGASGSASSYGGGGGGGGGWYGGAGGNAYSGCSGYPAGGGSSYVKAGLTNTVFTGGAREGAGQAIIKVVSVNQNPTSNNATINIQARGGNTTSIAASAIATDPDTTKTALAYTTNNVNDANKLDTMPASNAGLWVNGIGSKLATDYFDWNWSNGTLNITKVKKYPRSGVDGATADGKLKLYTYVRDTFGSNTQRGTAGIAFTVNVPINAMTQRTNDDEDVVTTKQNNNKLHFGISKNIDAPTGSAINTTDIYNPLGANRYTAIFEQPIKYAEEVTINASDLVLTDSNAVDYVTNTDDNNNHDLVVASLNSLTSITGSNRKYALTEYDANKDGMTAYNASRVKLSNVFSTLTFKCITPDPAYQVFTVTVYQVEKTTAYGSSYNNVVPGINAITVDIVFKMDNTRPQLRDSNDGPIVKVETLDTVPVSLNDYFKDVDASDDGKITSLTHKIIGVAVPTHEYVLTNKYGEIVSSYNTTAKKSYFNVLDEVKDISSILSDGQLKSDEYTTDFSNKYIYGPDNTDSDPDYAFVQYSYSGATLNLTGLRATHSMYKSGRTDRQAITGGTITEPELSDGVANAGHFYILLHVQDQNDTSDNDIWLPLGIEVVNKAPHTIATERGLSGSSTMPTAEGESGKSFYFTPMGITIKQHTYPIGVYKDEQTDEYTSTGLNALSADADNYYTSNMLDGLSLTEAGQASIGKLNELVTIKSSLSEIVTAIKENSGQYYFSVSNFNIYIPADYFGGRVDASKYTVEKLTDYYGERDCVVIQGLKITLKNWTHNRYLHLNVKMVDSAGGECTSQVAVNVTNTAPSYLDSSKVAQFNYTVDGVTVESTYSYTSESGVATINYRVPINTSFIVTPYDLLTDGNMLSMLSSNDDIKPVLNNGFTLNGLNGRFNNQSGLLTVGSNNANDGDKTVDALAKSVNDKSGGYDYTAGAYTASLFKMIKALQSKRSFGVENSDPVRVSTDNRFGTASSGETWVDRLYFARTTDESNLDGFTYDVYANRTAFVAPTVMNSNYVDYYRGSKISYQSNDYDLDYVIITAKKRTVSGSPAVLEFSVRDRTGAAATGNAYGVKTIRVEVNVINSSPRVQYPGKYYTLTTNPINIDATKEYADITTYTSSTNVGQVYPSTLVLYATNSLSTELKKEQNLLIDREDNEVWFDASKGCTVVSRDSEGNESASDSSGKVYSDHYIKVDITSTKMTITALSSTQAIQYLYIKFHATDGRYDDKGLLETSVCYIRIEVVNSQFTYNIGENGVDEVKIDDNNTQHLWNVESITAQDRTRARYFVSSSKAADMLRTGEEKASSAQIKYLVNDTDALQGVVLSAARSPENFGNAGYINAELPQNEALATLSDETSTEVGDGGETGGGETGGGETGGGETGGGETGGGETGDGGETGGGETGDGGETGGETGDGGNNLSEYEKALLNAYRAAVPQLSSGNTWVDANNAIAARIFLSDISGKISNNAYLTDTEVYENGVKVTKEGKVDMSNTDIIYFVGGEAYTAKELKVSNDLDILKQCFDSEGRWIVTDWAIKITPKSASTVGAYTRLLLSMRDETKYGGDTAGIATSYKAGISEKQKVVASQLLTYDLFVGDIGILPFTYFNQTEGYYTVTDPVTGERYVSTYDGTTDSQYKNTVVNDGVATAENIDISSLYLKGDQIVTESEGADLLKERTPGGTDNTYAGVHSGIVYSPGNNYTWDVYNNGSISKDKTESAFKYSDTIYVSADSSKYTYIPMSYFGLRQDLVNVANDGKITFPNDKYISYDIGSSAPYNRISGYTSAVTISDGKNTWTGGQENPYISITGYDVYNVSSGDDYENFNQGSYFNHALAIPTYVVDNPDKNNSGISTSAVDDEQSTTDDEQSNDGKVDKFVANARTNSYANHIVGENGRLLYLSGQENTSTGLQEHLFGLKIKKNRTRAQSASLTMTVKIVLCQLNGSTTEANYGTEDNTPNGSTNTAEITLKIEIGNSAINLVAPRSDALNGVEYDKDSGYVVNLTDLSTDSKVQNIALARDGVVVGADRTVLYEDNDIAYKMNDAGNYVDSDGKVIAEGVAFENMTTAQKQKLVRDDKKSDTAKFSFNSMRQLSNLAYSSRVYEKNSDVYKNVSTIKQGSSSTAYAQQSIKNYFNNQTEVNASFKPNGGIYANSAGEGFAKYFSVGLSSEGTALNITPLAKTTINPDMITGDVTSYYKERGLVYVAKSGNAAAYAYYPLKVLIYDDHGDGFGSASYVALEIRVAIKGAAARLSDNLDYNNPDHSDTDKSRKIEVSLAINQPYSLNIAHAITGGNLLTTSSNDIFWKANYDQLKDDVNNNSTKYSSDTLRNNDRFRLESGTYLQSPFTYMEGTSYASRVQNYTDNPNEFNNINKTLITNDENILYSSNPTYSGVSSTYLTDVIMYMEYSAQGKLNIDCTPEGNYVIFRVNRRTVNDSGEQVDKFKFLLTFVDSDGNKIDNLYVYINVVNQAPSIRTKATEAAAGLKMQVGDSFTVLTTPYNRFVGSLETDASSKAYTTPSSSASVSKTYNYVNGRDRNHISDVSLLAEKANPKYEDLTANVLDKDEQGQPGAYSLHSYDSKGGSNQHLGYLAIADDDMPWGLRIESVSYYNNKCFHPALRKDLISPEQKGYNQSIEYCLDVVITAQAVCTNMPITITLIDSDNDRVTFTMYVTVESSAPSAIDYGDKNHTLNPVLGPVYGPDASGKDVLKNGVYSMYMIANNVADTSVIESINDVSTETANYKTVTVDGVSGEQKAYGYARLPINQIAYDPDSSDVPAIYSVNGEEYHAVMLNGTTMNKKGNVYSNDMFEIVIADNFTWFTIECKTYNPASDYDVLSFYVRDSGNNVFEHAIPIEIHITTLYMSITNEAQMTNTAINSSIEQFRSIASINVKSYDSYSGNAVDLPADEKERNEIVNVNSVFPFLTYTGMKTAIDQTENSAKPLTDPDVVNSIANLNYELRIYAFLTNVGQSESEFEAMSLENISSLFNLNGTVVNKKVLALKSKEALSGNAFLNEKGIGIDDFLIGGFLSSGISISNTNQSLIMFLQRYFVFDIGTDGVSLTFRPVSANLDVNIPLYVQITKHIGNDRYVKLADVDITCGNIFYLNVMDSAPIATNDESVVSFAGKVGDSVVFKMYDKDDPFGSLFTDSDINDVVTYDGIISTAVPTANYDKALPDVEESGLDWKAYDTINKPRAVTIEYNNTDKEDVKSGIPAYSVKITINRRIDVMDDKGNYLPEVKLPIKLFCKDRGGESVTAEVKVTIQNSDIDIDRTKLTTDVVPDNVNGYYTLTADGEKDKQYYVDAYIMPGKALAPFYFVDSKNTYISDPDFTYMRTDTDSMRLVGKDSATSDTYLMHGKALSVTSALQKEPVATVTPIFGNDVMPNDANHFVGFSIEAHTVNRRISDAEATMRIVDRSGNPSVPSNGFTVTLRIHILNAAPTLKPVTNKPFVVTGSTTKDGNPITININDYVTDRNGDPLKIVGVSAINNDDPSLDNVHCVLDVDSSNDLVNMAIDQKDQTTCTFTPKMGYFGDQSVSVLVADIISSEDGTQYDYAITEFFIKFVVGYDLTSVTLNDITAKRSLPTKVDIKTLFNTLRDSHGITDYTTEEAGEFNPGDDYVITDLTASGVRVYRDGEDWMFVSDKAVDNIKFTVTFKNKAALDDPDVKSVIMSFNASIGKNTAPTLKDDFKNRAEEGYMFQTGGGEYGLNNSGTVILSPDMLFNDVDIKDGDKLTFDASSLMVASPTIASVRVSEDGTQLYITFNCRGETDLTVGVKDSTGETTKVTFKIKNIDRPEPSFWDNIVISYEVYPYIWWAVGAGLLLLILLLILIILLVKRRKRKREELEAILISEMELEEQMMRLNAGTVGSTAAYQSYGFLPPTMNVQNDPGMMLGAGGTTPNPDAIGLNPGDSGVSTDSDM